MARFRFHTAAAALAAVVAAVLAALALAADGRWGHAAVLAAIIAATRAADHATLAVADARRYDIPVLALGVMAASSAITHAAAIVVYAIPAALGRESAYHAARWDEVTGSGWDGVWAGNRYTGEYRMLRSRSTLAAGFRTRLYNLVRCPEGSPRVPFTTYREYPQPRWAERALIRWDESGKYNALERAYN